MAGLHRLARAAHRYPRQQAEYYLCRAIEQGLALLEREEQDVVQQVAQEWEAIYETACQS
jgi:hypothetical protein